MHKTDSSPYQYTYRKLSVLRTRQPTACPTAVHMTDQRRTIQNVNRSMSVCVHNACAPVTAYRLRNTCSQSYAQHTCIPISYQWAIAQSSRSCALPIRCTENELWTTRHKTTAFNTSSEYRSTTCRYASYLLTSQRSKVQKSIKTKIDKKEAPEKINLCMAYLDRGFRICWNG